MADNFDDLGISVELRAEMERFERNLSRAGRLVETSTRTMDKSTTRARKQFERLEGVLDPVARATQRLERDTRKVAAALDAGAVSENRAASVLARLNAQYENAVTGTQRFDRATGRARVGGVAMGTAVQQAGYQVGDFAVQIASGQNPLRAFIQQGTQLVSLFGPLGAVIGAAGAIAGAFATALLNLDDKTKKVEKSTRSYNELLSLSNDLTGDAAVLALELANTRRQIATQDARQQLKMADDAVKALEEEISLTQQLHDEFVTLGDTAGALRQFDALADLEKKLVDVRLRAKEAKLELDVINQDLGEFGGNGSVGGGSKTSNSGVIRSVPDRLSVLSDDRLQAANARQEKFRQLVQSLQTPLQKYTERIRDLSDAQRANFITESQFLAAKDAALQAYEDQREKLERVTSAAEGAARAFSNYGKATRQAADESGRVVTSGLGHMEDALVAFSLKTKSASEAFRDFASSVLSDLQRLLIRKSITGPLASAIGDFDFNNFFSTGSTDAFAFEGVRARASGGPVSGGSPYLVGEKGPELFVPGNNGVIVPNHQMGGAASGGMTVNMTLNNPTRDMVPVIIGELQKLGASVSKIDRSIESRAINATVATRRKNPKLFS